MPGGIPVATVAIGNAKNAGLLAAQILATSDLKLLEQIQSYRQELEASVLQKQTRLDEVGHHPYLKTMFPSSNNDVIS